MAILAKAVGSHLMIATVIFCLTACDLVSKKPQRIEFLDNSFAVMKPAGWSLRDDLNDVADLQMGNLLKEAYAIIISESKMDFEDISLQGHSDITRSMLREGLENYNESGPEYLENNEFSILRYRLTGTAEGVHITYWHVTIETAAHYHQMILWSLRSKFAKNKADFNAVIQSFEVISE